MWINLTPIPAEGRRPTCPTACVSPRPSGGGNARGRCRSAGSGARHGVPLPEHRGRAELRAQRDAPPAAQLGAVRAGSIEWREHRAQDDLHLERREARAEAAAAAAAERDPGVRPRRVVEEALGPERVRLGVDRPGRGGSGRRWRRGTTPGGYSQPPISTGCLTSRGSAFGSTGRRRSVSWIVAVRYASPSPASSSLGEARRARRARAPGARTPTPAPRRWSRGRRRAASSARREAPGGHRRAVLVARREQHRQDVVALPVARRGARRSARRCSSSAARASARSRDPRPAAEVAALQRAAASRSGLAPNSRIRVSSSRSASSRRPGSRPKTARRMISSVSP